VIGLSTEVSAGDLAFGSPFALGGATLGVFCRSQITRFFHFEFERCKVLRKRICTKKTALRVEPQCGSLLCSLAPLVTTLALATVALRAVTLRTVTLRTVTLCLNFDVFLLFRHN